MAVTPKKMFLMRKKKFMLGCTSGLTTEFEYF